MHAPLGDIIPALPNAGGRKDASAEPKRTGKNDNELLSKIRERFRAAESAWAENRSNWLEDVRFSCAADQWDEQVKRMRGADRPALTFNRLNGVVKQIIGDYRQNKLAIKVLPASGEASEDVAEILAGMIRNIEAQSNADMAYSAALECASRGGFGYFRVISDYASDDQFDQDLLIRPIHNPLTVYFDPAARLLTREDAEWCIITERVAKKTLQEQYSGKSPKDFDTAPGDTDMQDWASGEDVRVAEYFEKERYTTRLVAFANGMVVEIGDDKQIEMLAALGIALTAEREATRTRIKWCKVTGSTLLEERTLPCKYIPVIPVLGEEINVEGKVYTRGAIYYAKDAQRMLNYFKSVATETVALAPRSPWLVTPEHIQGFQDQWDQANVTPSPYLVYNHDASQPTPTRLPPPPQPVGEIALAMNAGDDIKATTGIYDASLGARSNETSGKAIVARQQQGLNATFLFLDNLKKAIEHCGRVLIDWMPHVYDTERVVRVIGLEGEPKTEVINRRVSDQLSGISRVLNSIAMGKYDVVITTGPNFANRRAEAVAGMSQLVQAYPPLMQIAGDLLVKNLDWPGAEEIAERLKRSVPPQLTMDPDSPEAQAGRQPQAPGPTPEEIATAHQAQEQQDQMQLEVEKLRLQEAKIAGELQLRREQIALEAQLKREQIAADLSHKCASEELRHRAAVETERVRGEALSKPTTQIQFNAEDTLNAVAERIEGMAQQQMDVSQQILAVTAQTGQMLAETLQTQQAAMTSAVQESTQGSLAVAEAVKELAEGVELQSRIAMAPRVAVRDSQGNIVASQIKMNPE